MSAVANVTETVANGKLTMVNVIDPQNPLLQLIHDVQYYITKRNSSARAVHFFFWQIRPQSIYVTLLD